MMTATASLNLPNTIDWNAIWNQQLTEHWNVYGGRSRTSQWNTVSAARRYWDRVHKFHQQRINTIIRDIDITPHSRVLDIGSGPGILSLPIAKQASHVTAVDPSPGMIAVLKEKMSEQGVSNIHCLQKYWEEVEPSRDLESSYDIVIASLSLDMLNIGPALEKMNQVSSKAVYLYWFAGEPSWEAHTRRLMPLLHGIPYSPFPKSDIIFNILYSMGIYPHIAKTSFRHTEQFSNSEEAMNHYKAYYRASGSKQEQVLEDYLATVLQKEKDGLISTSESTCLKIWWEKEN